MRRLLASFGLVLILPIVALADTTPPAAITDLAIASGYTTMVIAWTAPGDDGTTGTAAQYDVRYSTSAITSMNFSSATQLSMTAPKSAGETECLRVTNLSPCTTYYFAVKTADEVPNWSEISNLPSAATRCLDHTEVLCE